MMGVFDIPLVKPSAFSIGLASNSIIHQSPLTGGVQTIGRPGSRWKISLNYPQDKNSKLHHVEAFFNSLDGFTHRFRCPVWSHLQPLHGLKGSPRVRGANQLGNELITDGWLPNEIVLSPADFFEVAGELKQCTAVTNSDSSGVATIRFTPSLRMPPVDNAPINIDQPQGVFILASPETNVSTDKNMWMSLAYNALEAFP
jgi:hypothetical protein